MRLLKITLRAFNKLLRSSRFFTPTRIVVIGFITVIMAGALLLSTPLASSAGKSTPFLTSLFTATSATCVTGLVLVDTYQAWSLFGKTVILLLIQIGGLGFMSAMAFFFFLMHKQFNLSHRLVMIQSLSLDSLSGVVRLMKRILYGTLVFEGIGAIILGIRFSFDFGILKGFGLGVFHSVSAFCNAGFDLMGIREPFSSLMDYAADPVVNFTVMALVVIGGIGFYVWNDILDHKKQKKLKVHTKIVLTVTVILIVSGTLFFFTEEYSNPATLGGMNIWEKGLASLFQSVTSRTSGFNTINQADLSDASKIFTSILMFIGGSPGSTAGGIKTIAFGLIILTAFNTIRGKNSVIVYERTISPRALYNALSVTVVAFILCIAGSMVISLIENLSYVDILFETISAMGTVGLSTGITATLNPLSHIILIILMFSGRVGIMTIGIASIINQTKYSKLQYPETRVLL